MLLITALVLGMSYLWLQTQVIKASWQVMALENRLTDLRPRINSLAIKSSRLRTPSEIKARLQEQRIEMEIPDTDDIVRVSQAVEYQPEVVRRRLQPREDLLILSISR